MQHLKKNKREQLQRQTINKRLRINRWIFKNRTFRNEKQIQKSKNNSLGIMQNLILYHFIWNFINLYSHVWESSKELIERAELWKQSLFPIRK